MPLAGLRGALDARSEASTATPALTCAAFISKLICQLDAGRYLSVCVVARQISPVYKTRGIKKWPLRTLGHADLFSMAPLAGYRRCMR